VDKKVHSSRVLAWLPIYGRMGNPTLYEFTSCQVRPTNVMEMECCPGLSVELEPWNYHFFQCLRTRARNHSDLVAGRLQTSADA
jgi:hypothetical protein